MDSLLGAMALGDMVYIFQIMIQNIRSPSIKTILCEEIIDG